MQWYYFVLFGAVANAFFTIISKKTLMKEHSMEFSAANSFLVFIFSLPLLFFVDININTSQLSMIYLSSSLFTMAFLYGNKAVRHMDISIVAPLTTFFPVITAVLAIIFLNESLNFAQVIGIILLVMGAYALERRNKKSKLMDPLKMIFKSKYIHYLFISMLFFSFTYLIISYMTNASNPDYVSPITFMLLLSAFVSFNYFIITMLFYNGIKTYKLGLKPLTLMTMAALSISVYRLFQIIAISLPGSKLSLITSLNGVYVLGVVFIGGRLFHEHNIKRKIFSTIIMLVGIYLVLLTV